jgi:SAM-dependent methyltransferase
VQNESELQSSPTKTSLDAYLDGSYGNANTNWHAQDAGWKVSYIKKILESNTLNPESIVDVGCGAGQVLKLMSEEFPEIPMTGFDVSPQAIAMCQKKEKVNLTFRLGNLLQETLTFDCLLCIDVFEHVEDDLAFIRGLKSKCKFAVFHIPLDLSALGILRRVPEKSRNQLGHLHYYTHDTAVQTLKDGGFEILDIMFTPSYIDYPSTRLIGRVFKLPYRLLFKIWPHFTVRLLGMASLMVLAKPAK